MILEQTRDGEALLLYNRSSTSISDCCFLDHILEMKPNWALYGRLMKWQQWENSRWDGQKVPRPINGGGLLKEV